MPIFWIPVRGNGYFCNGKLIGEGQYINTNNCIIQKGIFNTNGLLHGSNNEIIDYSDSVNVNIRKGQYSEGKENGVIYEYVFAKSLWNDFYNGDNTTTTRYQHNFNNGIWQSTAETKNNIIIQGQIDEVDNKINNFAFSEL
jgi:hypothetical protein